jgi:dephospho-CoA kinase
LFETGSNKYFDYIINVDAPENLKISRILNRTNWDLEKIKLIMDNQLGEIFKRSNSNFTIMNDEIENIENIITEINKILLT